MRPAELEGWVPPALPGVLCRAQEKIPPPVFCTGEEFFIQIIQMDRRKSGKKQTSDLLATLQGPQERGIVGKLQVAPYRNTVGQAGNLCAERP